LNNPHILYSTEKVSAKSRLFKLAQLKNAELMRGKTVEEHRVFQQRLAEIRPIPPNISVAEDVVANVHCEWVTREESRTDKVILYIHGGSWAFGDLQTARPVGVLLAEATNSSVLVVDYRLSPEHPYPAGLDDCADVYRQLLRNGISPERLAVFGDSAGGNLALCLLHQLREEDTSLPSAVACASPVTDLSTDSALFRQQPDLIFTQHNGEERDIFSLYLDGQSPGDPAVSPILADTAGFPPILIHVGGDEALRDDNVAYANYAVAQGAPVVCKVWSEMFHDFTIAGAALRESSRSVAEIGHFFMKHMRQ